MLNSIFHPHERKMTEQEFLALNLDDIYIVDVRNAFELSGGHLLCANNIPFSIILTLPPSLPKDKIIFTYCNYGNRAGQAASHLYDNGYTAYSLGGYALFSAEIKNKCNVK